jgi:hypothetical protein
MTRTYNDIEWEVDSIIDPDIDGSGTRSVALSGTAPCAEGGGIIKFKAVGSQGYPYEGGYDEIEIEDEEFVPYDEEPE